jgi:hypothetical protein
MDLHRASQPTRPGRSPSGPRVWYRLILLVALASALVVVSLVTTRGGGGTPAQADPPAPGVQPAVQKWLKDREPLQIELNDALVPIAQKDLTNIPAAKAPCQRLKKAAHAMVARGKAPNPDVDSLARAGLAEFEQGANTCLTGDLDTAQRLVAEGLAERAAAAEPLDETLDGD